MAAVPMKFVPGRAAWNDGKLLISRAVWPMGEMAKECTAIGRPFWSTNCSVTWAVAVGEGLANASPTVRPIEEPDGVGRNSTGMVRLVEGKTSLNPTVLIIALVLGLFSTSKNRLTAAGLVAVTIAHLVMNG